MAREPGAPRPPGLADSLARLGRSAIGALRTRLEILGTEIEEERIRFAQLVLAAAAIAFCLQIAVLLFVIFTVVLFWETHRLATLGAFTVLFLVVGISGIVLLMRHLRRRPKMFASTLGELIKDEERLK